MRFKKLFARFQSVKAKVGFAIAIIFITVFGVFITYNNITFTYQSNISAVEKVRAVSSEYTSNFAKEIDIAVNEARSIAAIFAATKAEDAVLTLNRNEAMDLMKSVMKKNQSIFGACTVWEANQFDGLDSLYINQFPYDASGRFTPYLYKDIYGGIALETLNSYQDETQLWYWNVRRYKREYVASPEIYTVNNLRVMLTTFSVPILYQNQYFGVVAIDILFDNLQHKVEDAEIFNNSAQIRIYSHDGVVIADSENEKLAGKNISEFFNNPAHKLEQIRNGEITTQLIGNKVVAQVPFKVGNTTSNWQIEFKVPIQYVSKARRQLSIVRDSKILLSLFLLSGIIAFIFLYLNYLLRPLSQVSNAILQLSNGQTKLPSIHSTGLEIEQIDRSLKSYVETRNKQVLVLQDIAKGNFEISVDERSNEDVFAKSINKLIEGLKKARVQQAINENEAAIRRWTNEGIAKFAAILSEYSDDTNEFARKIIRNIIHYLSANQGAIYLINDTNPKDPYIELIAAFAYDRDRNATKRIELEEGLIGRSVDNKEVIYLKEIPKNYIHIGSGLGDKKPDCLLIVPLYTNDAVLGAIEIASFGEFEEHKRQFMQKVCENISITLQNIKINLQTRKLLKDSQSKAEMLSQQEEEMRQNYEELQTTQDIYEMREAESRSLINAINTNWLVAEFSVTGEFVHANEKFLQMFQITLRDIMGKKHQQFDTLAKENPEEYKKLWSKLLKGQVVTKKTHYANRNILLFETLTPVMNAQNEVVKIINIATNYTMPALA